LKFKKIVVLEPKPLLESRKEEFRALADSIQFYSTDPASPKEIIKRLENCDAVILGHTPLKNTSILEALPHLRYIGLDSTDYSFVDIELLKRSGIALTNVPDYATDAVANFIFSKLLEYYQKNTSTPQDTSGIKDVRLNECLKGKVMGIIGVGRIGTRIANIAQSYNMDLLYFSRTRKKEMEGQCLKYASLINLLESSDIVVIACSLNKESYNLLSKERLTGVKKGSIIVNIARADIMDYDALTKGLNSNQIAAAILDVLPNEPAKGNESILSAKNTILSPHIAWKTPESMHFLYSTVISNMRYYLNGKKINRVV
jgi:glycerate dehydrogenase